MHNIDKTQKTKMNICGNKDETVNYIIIESNNLARKEYKNRYNWV